MQPKGTTGTGTTSTTVIKTVKTAEDKNAKDDTMKKDCTPTTLLTAEQRQADNQQSGAT